DAERFVSGEIERSLSQASRSIRTDDERSSRPPAIPWFGVRELERIQDHEQERWSQDEFYSNVRQTLRELPTASIGQPEVWELSELYPAGQLPAAIRAKMDEDDFYLVRITCSLRPEGGFNVTKALFQIGLTPGEDGRQARAFDLY